MYMSGSAYFAHPELLLLAMLSSEDQEERVLAAGIICERIREGAGAGSSLPRKFVPPKLNFQADCIHQLIDGDSVPLSEPVITASLTHRK